MVLIIWLICWIAMNKPPLGWDGDAGLWVAWFVVALALSIPSNVAGVR